MTQKKDHQGKFHELLSPTSRNFLGTGLTLQEFVRLGVAERIEAAWFQQAKEERQRRLSFVLELSAELARIKTEHVFATAMAERGIEAIIEGDWELVREWAETLTFPDDGKTSRYRDVYARFCELLNQAYATRPSETVVKA